MRGMNKKNTPRQRSQGGREGTLQDKPKSRPRGTDSAWSSYASRLNWAMQRAGKTNQSELARAVGVKPQSIQYLCDPQGGAQGSSHTPSLARELNVSAEWLAAGVGSPDIAPPFKAADVGALNTKETAPGYAIPSERDTRLPVRRAARLSGQGEVEGLQAQAQGEGTIDLRGLPLFAQPPRVTALRVKGNALAPWAKDGQFLLTEPAPVQLAAEDQLLLRLRDGRQLIRELMVVRDDSLLVLPVLGGQAEAIDRHDIDGMELVVCVLPRRYGEPGA
jgi:hypothetical protein